MARIKLIPPLISISAGRSAGVVGQGCDEDDVGSAGLTIDVRAAVDGWEGKFNGRDKLGGSGIRVENG